MNSNLSPRPKKRKQQHQDEMKEQIVAQVHKPVFSNTSSDNDYGSIQSANSEDNLESNRTYTKFEEGRNDMTFTKHDIMTYEDKNENISMHTPSREISVDGESQINSKILSLIETEMRRDINKHSHFTDSRPQSLSFYEDEKVPEELSGNLELLSPEERKHYKRRKEYNTQMDTDEMNAYNSLQDVHNGRDLSEDIMTSSIKKTKSKKKRHGGDGDLGMGDSREMMIPKERKKSKKKKRDTSPVASKDTKRKHKKREDADYDLRTEIAVALEELQDDVFDNSAESVGGARPDKMKNKSPRKSDKLYIQKKNKFEVSTKPTGNQYLNRQGAQEIVEDGKFTKRCSIYPLEVAIIFQRWWMRLSTLCHGLLGGLALGHWLYLVCNFDRQDSSFLLHYAYYSDIYVGLFFALCVLCIVSVLDRIDIGHLEKNCTKELWKQKRCSFVLVVYVSCLMVHLSTANFDDNLTLMSYRRNINDTIMVTNMTRSELRTWNHLSLWRALLAFTAWIFLGLGPPEDMLYHHLKNLEAYLPNK
ncbi:uncharacterized protein [Leptinotarsa decemlineata]|uniref:uncharacterized protein n=1 Tax=Leptinotarsa decemlineata TaxID=7539 RepID=UPI003D304095